MMPIDFIRSMQEKKLFKIAQSYYLFITFRFLKDKSFFFHLCFSNVEAC